VRVMAEAADEATASGIVAKLVAVVEAQLG
jgi:hypothetical protein